MAETVITGREGSFTFGAGTDIEVKDWKLTRKNKVAALATSLTAGFQTTAQGITSWDLSFTAILPAGDLSIIGSTGLQQGTKVAFQGYSATGGTGVACTGNARIDSIEEAVPIEGGELVANMHAIGDGVYTIT